MHREEISRTSGDEIPEVVIFNVELKVNEFSQSLSREVVVFKYIPEEMPTWAVKSVTAFAHAFDPQCDLIGVL